TDRVEDMIIRGGENISPSEGAVRGRRHGPMASAVPATHPQPERIIKVAARQFSQRGYEATKLKDIAASCNFTHAAIYSYYSSKMTILETIFDRMVTKFQ